MTKNGKLLKEAMENSVHKLYMAKGGPIVDPRGQWAHPGKITKIPSNKITMQGVPYPVYGVPDFGQPQMMYPGQEYFFPGAQNVTEYPKLQVGGDMYIPEGMTLPNVTVRSTKPSKWSKFIKFAPYDPNRVEPSLSQWNPKPGEIDAMEAADRAREDEENSFWNNRHFKHFRNSAFGDPKALAVAGTAALLGPQMIPYMGAALQAPIAGVAGLTGNNLLTAAAAYHGVKSLPNTVQSVKTAYNNPNRENVINAVNDVGWNALDLFPAASVMSKEVKPLVQEIGNAFNASGRVPGRSSLRSTTPRGEDPVRQTVFDPETGVSVHYDGDGNVIGNSKKLTTNEIKAINQGMEARVPIAGATPPPPEGMAPYFTANTDRIMAANAEWLQSPEYLSRRMAASGETAAQVKADVARILEEAKNTKFVVEPYKNKNLDGLYSRSKNPGWFDRNILREKATPAEVSVREGLPLEQHMGTLDHEIKHAMSQFAASNNYKGYPTLKVGNWFDRNIKGLGRHKEYLNEAPEQQVRFLKILEDIEKSKGIPKGETITPAQFDDWVDTRYNPYYSKSANEDVVDLVNEIANTYGKDTRKKLLDRLNRAYLLPAGILTGAGALEAGKKEYGGDLNIMQRGGAYVDSVFNSNGNLNWVKRLYDKNTPSIQIPGQPYPSTHFMEYSDNRVYPQVVQMPDGKLKHLGKNAYDYADSTKTYIKFPTEADAKWFSENYKKGKGVLGNRQKGGSWNWLNPMNWGVPDYSDKGNFDQAYAVARKNNDKEFMYGSKRIAVKDGGKQASYKMIEKANPKFTSLYKTTLQQMYGSEDADKRYNDMLDLHLKYGNPKVNVSEQLGRAYFNPAGNEMFIYGNDPVGNYVAEMNHARDLAALGTKAYDEKHQNAIKRNKAYTREAYDKTMYKDPNSTEAVHEYDYPLQTRLLYRNYGLEQDDSSKARAMRLKVLSDYASQGQIDPYAAQPNLRVIQRALHENGYQLPGSIKADNSFDGIYGNETKRAFEAFKKSQPKMASGGEHGGLDRWFAEKWVDVKSGKECGRDEGEKRKGYPACRPSRRVNEDTPKTASELSSAEREKFKRSKTSSERINYQHRRMQDGGEQTDSDMANKPNNPALWSKAKSAAKAKYDVYPSAYANGYAAKWYKSKGGTWSKAAYGMEVMEQGGGTNNPGFEALPDYVQAKILSNMGYGGMTYPFMQKGGEPDGSMALGQIDAAMDKLQKLRQFIQPDSDLEPWISSKLTMMDDYADAVSDYMMYNPDAELDELDQMRNGGYVVTRSDDRKGKTHKVTGPDGSVKYFGDSKLGQHPNDPERKEAFYARHEKNLKNNPHFRAFARKTWADGGALEYGMGGMPCYECGGAMYKEGGMYDCPDQEKDPVTGKCKAEVVRGREANAANKAANADMNAWAKQVAAMDKEVAKQNAAQYAGQRSFDYDWMQSPVDKAEKKAAIAQYKQFIQQNPNVFVADDSSGVSPEQKYIIASKLKQKSSTPMGSKAFQQKFNQDARLLDLGRIQSDIVPLMGGWSGIQNWLFGNKKFGGYIGQDGKRHMSKTPTWSGNAGYKQGGPVIGEEMEVTPEQLDLLRAQGYEFEII